MAKNTRWITEEYTNICVCPIDAAWTGRLTEAEKMLPDVRRLHTWSQARTHTHADTHNNNNNNNNNNRGREDCQEHSPSLRSLSYFYPQSSTFGFLLNVPLWSSMLQPAGQLTQWQAFPKDHTGWLNSQQSVKTPSVHPCGTCFPVYGLQMEALWVWKKPIRLCCFKLPVSLMRPYEAVLYSCLYVQHKCKLSKTLI